MNLLFSFQLIVSFVFEVERDKPEIKMRNVYILLIQCNFEEVFYPQYKLDSLRERVKVSCVYCAYTVYIQLTKGDVYIGVYIRYKSQLILSQTFSSLSFFSSEHFLSARVVEIGLLFTFSTFLHF